MGIVNFAEYLQSLLQSTSVEGNVVRIIADNGDELGDAVFKVIQGGNGVSEEVAIGVQEAGGTATATGLAFMTLDVGVVGAAIAPCLGVLAGTGLYALSPDFWTSISNTLVYAGKTIGGRVIAKWNGENLYFDEEVIEIFKNALLEAGIFDSSYTPPEIDTDEMKFTLQAIDLAACKQQCAAFVKSCNVTAEHITACLSAIAQYNGNDMLGIQHYYYKDNALTNYSLNLWTESWENDTPISFSKYQYGDTLGVVSIGGRIGHWTVGSYYGDDNYFTFDYENPSYIYRWQTYFPNNPSGNDKCFPHFGTYIQGSNVQEGAVTPKSDEEFPLTYPTWIPYEYPQTLPDPSEMPDVYPVKYPGVGPDGYPTQEPAQNPDPENVPDIYPEILPDFDIPEPGINPSPEPEPDPDPQPEGDPIPEAEPNPGTDPIDPNPTPDPSLPIVVPGLPSTVSSNKLFTVYNPTSSQLDALGGYLWDSSIIAAIRDIWQEPMDGLISLQQVFVTPSTSGSHNIILGFLDSGVSAAVVSSQFVTVDCGSVQVNENKNNATDYAPYTSLHLYLPFIGIVELDTNECMNSTISIKYKVDVYTGTCLAQISVDRDADMPNDPILYTFSGNCSQQLPLTSGNATGLLTALIGAVTAGISAASGGGLSTLAGAQLLGNSLTHEMFHVSHSGNISANAGIMGQKKPYLIIGRRHGYDANNYNSYYGYPANKTITIGNHSGFLRVKKCWLQTTALQEEYNEIMELLEEGIFV